MTTDINALRARVGAAITAGDLGQAYIAIKTEPKKIVMECMLREGFSGTFPNDDGQFWREIQGQLAKACSLKQNGWQQRENEHPIFG